MSLTLGELIGYIRGDDSQFVNTLDSADHRMDAFQRSTDGTLRDLEGDFGQRGRAMGVALRGGLDETLSALHPQVQIDANSRPADEEVARLFGRLEALHADIDVDAPDANVLRELDVIHAALTDLSQQHADPQVRADTANALFSLNGLRGALDDVDAQHPHVRVDVDAAAALAELHEVDRAENDLGRNDGPGRAGGLFGMLTSAIGGVMGPLGGVIGQAAMMAGAFGAAVPIIAGLVATLVNVAPAAAIGATAVLSLASAVGAIKLGTSGIGAAFKAAFAPATGGGAAGAAANTARQVADATRAVKDATQQAAYANQQAAEQTARAERNVADAQKAARQAQLDLNDARVQATRDLQDLNDQLTDSRLNERQASLDVTTALEALNAARAQGLGPGDQLNALQLAYDQAVQKLKEAREQTDRLSTDVDKANKAGVDGSTTMVNARQKIADTNRNLADQEKALADARQQQARTAAQGLESIQKAEEALAAAGAKAASGGGGVNKLAQALAALSPNARAFVLQAIALKGAWTAFQQSIQNRLFAGLAGELKDTAGVLLPVLRTNLLSSAGALNDMARGAAASARSVGRDGTLGTALRWASDGLHNLAGIPAVLIRAFAQFAAAAGPAFGALTQALGGKVASIGGAIDRAFKSGHLADLINTAVGLLKEIGTIGANVFSILGSVMKATQATGGGFLGVLKIISGELAKAFASPAIQAGLRALFSTMEVLGKTAAPLLVQALRVIAPVLTALAPPAQRLIAALGSALRPVIAALGPVLVAAALAVGQLADAIDPLLVIAGQMIASLGPVLTPVLLLVGQLFAALAPPLAQLGRSLLPPLAKITGTLVAAFAKATPVLSSVLKQLGDGGLTPIIVGLGLVIGQLVSRYADQWLMMFEQLLPVLPQLVPVLLQLGQSIGQILVSLAPLLPQITLLATQLIAALLPAILPLLPVLVQAEVLFLRLATGAITKVVIPALTLLTRAASGLLHGLEPMVTAATWVTTHIAGAFQWLYDVLLGHSIIPDIVNGTVRWFAGLPGRAWSALSGLAGNIASRAKDAGTELVSAIKTGLSNAVGWLGGLPGRAVRAIGDLSGTLYRAGQALLSGFVSGITSMGSVVNNAVSSVLSGAADFFPHSPARKGPFSGKGWTPFSGAAAGAGFAMGLLTQAGTVGSAARALAGAASAELTAPGTAGGALVAPPRGLAGGAAAGGTLTARVTAVLDIRGGDDALTKALREAISVRGGDVQLVLGSG